MGDSLTFANSAWFSLRHHRVRWHHVRWHRV